MIVENKALEAKFELVEVLTQGLLEKFEAHLAKDGAEGNGLRTVYGKYLRAAIACGWVKDPRLNDDQISQMDPRAVALIGSKISDLLREATTIPPA